MFPYWIMFISIIIITAITIIMIIIMIIICNKVMYPYIMLL